MERVLKWRHVALAFAVIALVAIFAYEFRDTIGPFGDQRRVIAFVEQFGAWAPLIIIGITIAEVIIAPLPGSAAAAVAGFLFGPIQGTFYAWVGNVVGSVIVFLLTRRFGKRIIHLFVSSFDEQAYSGMIERYRGLLWILYAVPATPVDVLSFALGATVMNFWRFFFLMASAFLVRMALWSFFGDALGGLLFT